MDAGVVECLDNDNKDNFDLNIRNRLNARFRYFLLTPPLEKLLEGTLGGFCIVRHDYMKEAVLSETYAHFYHDHEQIKPKVD